MLAENHNQVPRCSSAYSERRQALVVQATRFLRIIDESEFEMLITFVGAVAEKYEREVVGEERF